MQKETSSPSSVLLSKMQPGAAKVVALKSAAPSGRAPKTRVVRVLGWKARQKVAQFVPESRLAGMRDKAGEAYIQTDSILP